MSECWLFLGVLPTCLAAAILHLAGCAQTQTQPTLFNLTFIQICSTTETCISQSRSFIFGHLDISHRWDVISDDVHILVNGRWSRRAVQTFILRIFSDGDCPADTVSVIQSPMITQLNTNTLTSPPLPFRLHCEFMFFTFLQMTLCSWEIGRKCEMNANRKWLQRPLIVSDRLVILIGLFQKDNDEMVDKSISWICSL